MKKTLGILGLSALAVLGLASCNSNNNSGNNSGDNGGNTGGDGGNTSSTYTYNLSLSTFPTNWNPHTYETNTDAEITGYTTNGFYEFDYNDTKDGYKIVPAMATGAPVDVTANYVGDEWNITSDETGRAWSIPLRTDLKWQDGTAITAEDFVDSAKKLLNPVAQNHRADSLYSGNLVIENAKNYLYQGSTSWFASDDVYEEYSEDLWEDIVFKLGPSNSKGTGAEKAQASFRDSFGFPASYTAEKTASYLAVNYLADTAFTTEVAAKMEGKTMKEIQADAEMKAAWETLIGWWQSEPNEELDFFVAAKTFEEVDFDEVGVKADGNNLIVILDNSLEGFYLLYALSDSWLVNKTLYEANESVTNGLYTNTYGTSVDTFASYGPYKLTYFQQDKEFRFEKNEYWYGYNDEANKDLYQTTNIVYKYVAEDSTRLQMFESGQLDVYGLNAEDMNTYGNSDYLYYTQGASTFFIALNPDMEGLTSAQTTETTSAGSEMNKTILTLLSFRQALSLAVDRKKFCLACDPTGMPAKAIFNGLIISDPENGTSYRASEEAKDIVLAFWGLTDQVGEGKRYATKDEAIDAITGVDLTQAKEKFNQAYDEAIEQGLMTADAKISIKIGIPSSATFYTNGYNYLTSCWTDAVKGTKLEGKLVFSKDDTIGNNFSDALKENQVDLLFGVGWTGSALDPYYLISAYTDPEYQYDPAIDYSTMYADVTFASITDVDGVEYKNITLRTDVLAWSKDILMGEGTVTVVSGSDKKEITINCGSGSDLTNRCLILNACEKIILEQYTLLPLDDEASSSLKGMKVKYYTEDYIYGIGRGGIKYMTYNYTDAEWDAFVSSKGGKLNYK